VRLLLLALVISAPAEAKKKVMFWDATDGSVYDARLKPMEATVRLTCVTTAEPSDENHWRRACESTLQVERNGKVVAKANAPGIDFEAVGSNLGGLSLSLVEGFIAVDARSREGDEQLKFTETRTLYVVDGKRLREVFSYRTEDSVEPGPDSKDEVRATTSRVLDAGPIENGLPTFTLSSADTVIKVTWDGNMLVEGPLLSEALIAKVLAGQLLEPEELKPLHQESLLKLRNAPYARHGRAFKNPALQAYFYGDGKRKVDPAFTEKSLDAADKANLSLIIAEIKSR
jgi:hypothetical protein